MKTDPTYGMAEDFNQLDDDETKLIHLFNLVHHEDQVDFKYVQLRKNIFSTFYGKKVD